MGSSSHPIFLFSLMWDLWFKQTSPALRWGETPTPSALKPYPVCAPAQAWELPRLWLGINIPCPGRGSVSTQRDHGPHIPLCPAPPAPRAPHQSCGEPLMCVWGQQGGGWHARLSHPTDVVSGSGGTRGLFNSHFCHFLVLTEFDAGQSQGGVGSGDCGQAGREGEVPV